MEKEYIFDVNLNIEIQITAKSEAGARKQLTEQVADYFRETEIEIGKKEAKLVGVVVDCGNCGRPATQSTGEDYNRCDRCANL
jgi:formylmethanofuran dehydrogenase subunit E